MSKKPKSETMTTNEALMASLLLEVSNTQERILCELQHLKQQIEALEQWRNEK